MKALFFCLTLLLAFTGLSSCSTTKQQALVEEQANPRFMDADFTQLQPSTVLAVTHVADPIKREQDSPQGVNMDYVRSTSRALRFNEKQTIDLIKLRKIYVTQYNWALTAADKQAVNDAYQVELAKLIDKGRQRQTVARLE